METLKAICSAIASVFGLLRDRSAVRNAPAMQANATARTDAAIKRQSTELVAEAQQGDADALRKLREAASE